MDKITCMIIISTSPSLDSNYWNLEIAEAQNRWAPFIQALSSAGRSSTNSVIVGAVGSANKQPHHNATTTVRVVWASVYYTSKISPISNRITQRQRRELCEHPYTDTCLERSIVVLSNGEFIAWFVHRTDELELSHCKAHSFPNACSISNTQLSSKRLPPFPYFLSSVCEPFSNRRGEICILKRDPQDIQRKYPITGLDT